MNNNLVLLCGKSVTGKSMSLRNLADPKNVMYLNCENNKGLPFKSEFQEFTITDPHQIYEAFDHAETDPKVHTIVIDSLTYMMDMFETIFVIPHAGSKKGMSAWGDYAQFFKRLMSQYVGKSTKNIIFTAHTSDIMNEAEMINETLVKVKGSLMNQGIESYFSTVISTKKMSLKKLEQYSSKLLTVSDEEEMLGFKHCYQVKLTKDTVDERIRSSLGMWDIKETYIDNDVQHVINRLHNYYK